MAAPSPTPIYRMIHIDNLSICLQRGALHAPNHTPNDGLVYRTVHDEDVQAGRSTVHIPCGPGGTIHDYVPFYFGPRSPMLYRLHTGWRVKYAEGQEPLIYLGSTAQGVHSVGLQWVFTDGHGLAGFTAWYDDLGQLDELDWETIYATQWADTEGDMDRQRRKQAEFLVHRACPWHLIDTIGVLNREVRACVERVQARFSGAHRPAVEVRPDWYY